MTDQKPKKIWDNFQEVAEVQKSAAIKFVVAAATRDGIKYVNIREFYFRKRDGKWMPGRDGITIPMELPLERGKNIIEPYKHLIVALVDTVDALSVMDLYDDEHAVWYTPKAKAE